MGRIERSVCGCGLDTPVIRPLPPNPQRLSVTYLGSRALGRWPRQNEVIRVGPRPVRLVFLTRRGDREADSQRGDPVSAWGGGGGGIHTPSREAAGGTSPAHASISGFQPPGLWGDAVP